MPLIRKSMYPTHRENVCALCGTMIKLCAGDEKSMCQDPSARVREPRATNNFPPCVKRNKHHTQYAPAHTNWGSLRHIGRNAYACYLLCNAYFVALIMLITCTEWKKDSWPMPGYPSLRTSHTKQACPQKRKSLCTRTRTTAKFARAPKP